MYIKTEYTVIFKFKNVRQQSFSISQLHMSTILIYKNVDWLIDTLAECSIGRDIY